MNFLFNLSGGHAANEEHVLLLNTIFDTKFIIYCFSQITRSREKEREDNAAVICNFMNCLNNTSYTIAIIESERPPVNHNNTAINCTLNDLWHFYSWTNAPRPWIFFFRRYSSAILRSIVTISIDSCPPPPMTMNNESLPRYLSKPSTLHCDLFFPVIVFLAIEGRSSVYNNLEKI